MDWRLLMTRPITPPSCPWAMGYWTWQHESCQLELLWLIIWREGLATRTCGWVTVNVPFSLLSYAEVVDWIQKRTGGCITLSPSDNFWCKVTVFRQRTNPSRHMPWLVWNSSLFQRYFKSNNSSCFVPYLSGKWSLVGYFDTILTNNEKPFAMYITK